jgi:hypothetical protein
MKYWKRGRRAGSEQVLAVVISWENGPLRGERPVIDRLLFKY